MYGLFGSTLRNTGERDSDNVLSKLDSRVHVALCFTGLRFFDLKPERALRLCGEFAVITKSLNFGIGYAMLCFWGPCERISSQHL